ncbi:MAG TPA: hypothetical protein VGL86_08880 [Polyangia bacterium]|jgi:hypothetical protein
MNRSALALAFVVVGTPACKRDTSSHGAAVVAAAQPSESQPENRHRDRGKGAEEAGVHYKNPIVYVDGETRASLTYNEMPSTVKILERDGGAHHVLVCDYFRAIGVDCSTIKETHWYGAKGQLAAISGAELRRTRNSLGLDFTNDLSGRPRIEWDSASGLRSAEKPEFVADVSVYVKLKVPKWDPATQTLIDAHGDAFDGIPYNHDDGKRGVRVNVDGRLVAKIKRNLLEGNIDPVRAPKPGEDPRYRLVDFLAASADVTGQIRGIDLLVRDERVVRLSKADLDGGVEFAAAQHHHGEMMFYFSGREVPALAIDVWAKTDAPDRPLRDAATPALHARR